jgi:hypothetical protein
MIKRNEEREKFLFVMLILAIGFTSVIFCAIPNEIKYRSALEAVQAPIQREVSKLTLNSSWSFGTKAVSGCQLKNASTSRESCFDIMYVSLIRYGFIVPRSP